MTYLLTLGWPWFAGALALGAFIGLLTFSRGARFSGGWVALLGVLALAMGFATSFADVLSGRDAATLDIALLAGGAYAAGLPLGGVLKSFTPEAERTRAPIVPLMLAPAVAAEEASPLAAPVDAFALPDAPEPEAPAVEEVAANAIAAEAVAAEAPAASMAPVPAAPVPAPAAPAPARARKPAPGAKPDTLPAPRGGADDLARIKGIGPKSLEKLHALGVFHYDQIAAWNLENAKWIGASIGAPGRVERDKWIQQARTLSGAGMEQ